MEDLEKQLKEVRQANMAFKETAYQRRNLLLLIWDVIETNSPDEEKTDEIKKILRIGGIKGKV